MSVTLRDSSDYARNVSSGWVAGISELYDQLSNAALTEAQKYQAIADFNCDAPPCLREGRELFHLAPASDLLAQIASSFEYLLSPVRKAFHEAARER